MSWFLVYWAGPGLLGQAAQPGPSWSAARLLGWPAGQVWAKTGQPELLPYIPGFCAAFLLYISSTLTQTLDSRSLFQSSKHKRIFVQHFLYKIPCLVYCYFLYLKNNEINVTMLWCDINNGINTILALKIDKVHRFRWCLYKKVWPGNCNVLCMYLLLLSISFWLASSDIDIIV